MIWYSKRALKAKDLYTGNYKTLVKKIKDTNEKISHVHGLKNLILLR